MDIDALARVLTLLMRVSGGFSIKNDADRSIIGEYLPDTVSISTYTDSSAPALQCLDLFLLVQWHCEELRDRYHRENRSQDIQSLSWKIHLSSTEHVANACVLCVVQGHVVTTMGTVSI